MPLNNVFPSELLTMTALAAVLVAFALVKFRRPPALVVKVGAAFNGPLSMPLPVILKVAAVRLNEYAGAPTLNCMVSIDVLAVEVTVVMGPPPKVAIPVGTAAIFSPHHYRRIPQT
jgi:hypothetical protein